MGPTGAKVISLDGVWRIALDPDNAGLRDEWHRAAPAGADRDACVPGTVQGAFPDYHGLAWYYREFDAPAHPIEKGRALLTFHEVDFACAAWLNGMKVGEHEGLEEIFSFDVTDAVALAGPNLLAVRVLSPTNGPIDGLALGELAVGRRQYPEPNDHALATGGIIGSVELSLVPEGYISDVYAIPDWLTGEVEVRVEAVGEGSHIKRCAFIAACSPAVGGRTLAEACALGGEAAAVSDAPRGAHTLSLRMRVPDHRLWGLDDPYLYRATVRLTSPDGLTHDEKSVRFGFRDFRYERGYFRLNGRRIRINGALYTVLNFPGAQSIPHDEDHIRRDVTNMKALGLNFVRIHCGSLLPRQLDALDEMGLLAVEESFGAGWPKDSPRIGPDWERSVTRVIRRDRNHPSIVIWSLLNEQKDNRLFRHAAASIPAIRALDETRLLLLNS
ncbi:MAG: hypothetical protein FWE70_06265, partial [Oscillospiraceae bacterium]|nr:hypothetical protein [Oscillospiraceae bacterium]